MDFWKDQFKEEKNGKYSSKKFWGFIVMFLVSAAFILDGLHFYDVNNDMFNSMLVAGVSLLGLRIVANLFNGRKVKEDVEPK